jgi:hypothetical protein
MLVRFEAGEEPAFLEVDDFPVDVLRVRHPLPAIHRMHVVRPLVVIVSTRVRADDVALIKRAAKEISAVMLQHSPLVTAETMRAWVCDAIDRAASLRAERAVRAVAQ